MNVFLYKRVTIFFFFITTVLMFMTNCTEKEDDRIIPTKVLLTSIIISDFPDTTKQGGLWDLNSSPDITIKISDVSSGSSETIIQTDTLINPIHDTTYIFNFNPPVLFPEIERRYELEVFDIDNNFLEYDPMLDAGLILFDGRPISREDSTTYWMNGLNGFDIQFHVLYRF